MERALDFLTILIVFIGGSVVWYCLWRWQEYKRRLKADAVPAKVEGRTVRPVVISEVQAYQILIGRGYSEAESRAIVEFCSAGSVSPGYAFQAVKVFQAFVEHDFHPENAMALVSFIEQNAGEKAQRSFSPYPSKTVSCGGGGIGGGN
jgi:hypothetical protein